MFGLGGGKPRSAAEEEELLEELAEEEEDAGMMESVLRTSTGYAHNSLRTLLPIIAAQTP